MGEDCRIFRLPTVLIHAPPVGPTNRLGTDGPMSAVFRADDPISALRPHRSNSKSEIRNPKFPIRYNPPMEHRTEIRRDPWTHALESLRAGHRTVLVKVVDHSGSVPGVTGTMVTVSELGIAGTIGGGAAEMELVEKALVHDEGSEIVRFRHTPGEGGTMCSGLQVFAVILLTHNDV